MCDVFKVAKSICEKRDWKATNLELQKLLYIAQVFSFEVRKKRLFDAEIQAWKYGPVIPKVYGEFKKYSNSYIPKSAFSEKVKECNKDENDFIDKIAKLTKDIKGWQLVGLTHRSGTAWDKNFKDNILYSIIPEEDMKDEFKNVWSKSNVQK